MPLEGNRVLGTSSSAVSLGPRPMLAYPCNASPTPRKTPLLREPSVREEVAAWLLSSFTQLCPLCKPAVGFCNGMHDASRHRDGHAGGDNDSFGFQSTPALRIAGIVIQSFLHQLKSLPSTRKRGLSNWVPALGGQRRGERATNGSQARAGPGLLIERTAVDPATPPCRGKYICSRGRAL